jgi:hypothetical protein
LNCYLVVVYVDVDAIAGIDHSANKKGRLLSGDPVSSSLCVLRDDSGDAFGGGVIVVVIIRAKSRAHCGGNDTTELAVG